MRTFTLILAASAVLMTAPWPAGAAPADQPLVQQGDIQYLGAFLLPQGNFGTSRFGYGGAAPGYYKDSLGRETLYMEGHSWYKGNVAQVRIPNIVNSRNMSSLQRATIMQNFADITDGQLGGNNGDGLGSLMPWNGKLIVGSYVYYDGGGTQQRFVGDSGFDVAVPGDFRGFYAPAPPGPNPGKLGRYMTPIPAEWRPLFRGPALSGACCLSIIGRTNFGPGASVFFPEDIGVKDPVPFNEVLGYISTQTTVGDYGDSWNPAAGNYFTGTTNVEGIAFPAGTRSVLFFGTGGTGPYCYGYGTSQQPPPPPDANGVAYCYDPAASSKGTHGYPYAGQIWAYDANDLVEVIESDLVHPWKPKPYGVWLTQFQFSANGVDFNGATFDPATNRVFIVEANGEDPIVHVLKINTVPAVSDTVPPARPKGLRTR